MNENMKFEGGSWSYFEQWMEDCYWDTFSYIENLIDYWEDDRIDRLLISYNEWLMWEYH